VDAPLSRRGNMAGPEVLATRFGGGSAPYLDGSDLDPADLPSVDPSALAEWQRWIAMGSKGTAGYLEYNSFSGVDIHAAVWMPPNSQRKSGTYKQFGSIQTITISSERPSGPVRCLGFAGARGYVRGVRTIAGSLIFTVLDRDVFAEVYQQSDNESIEEFPLFVDQIPTFHIVATAANEMGFTSSLSIIECTLTNFGMTLSVDDLMIEQSFTYVARYVSPFMNKGSWRAGLAGAVSRIQYKMQPLSRRAQFPIEAEDIICRDRGLARGHGRGRG